MIKKYFWVLKSYFYKLSFRKFEMPSYLASPLFLLGTSNVIIMKKVRIFPGARIETHNGGQILIEENVGIAQNFHITSSEGMVKIGKDTTIAANTFITNIDHEYREINIPILSQPFIIKDTVIGENCFIGSGVAIQAGTVLGKQCVVGANSVVRGIFPDYCVIVGSPAKIVKMYNFETQTWDKV